MVICQCCERVSLSKAHCSHTDCDNHKKYQINPYSYICFDIHHQLQQIFYREDNIKCFTLQSQPSNNSMSDVYDGEVYRSLLREVETNEVSFIITLIMNVDGIAIGNNTEESLWIMTCAINEIKRQDRFKIHNAIICGICSCFKKPSRSIMQILLKPIVEQLLLLEKHHLFQMKAYSNDYKLIRTYLIGVCNDKPANSLVQNAPEPIGKYGCTRCELSVDDDQIYLRSTARYELIAKKLAKSQHRNQHLSKEDVSNLQLGYLGKCTLTNLSYFDHGYSFLMDTLHTIYHGAFKRLMKLWFHSKYRAQQWSIRQYMQDIEGRLASSTNGSKHLPREIENNLELIKNSSYLADTY
ncbi:unnamed protein product, partial [Rotaria magnacalcarata]